MAFCTVSLCTTFARASRMPARCAECWRSIPPFVCAASRRSAPARQAERVQHFLVVPPVRLHFHAEVEIHLAVEEARDVLTRFGADLLDHRPGAADDDRLL